MTRLRAAKDGSRLSYSGRNRGGAGSSRSSWRKTDSLVHSPTWGARGGLGLHAGQVLDRAEGGQRVPAQQQLAVKGGAVKGEGEAGGARRLSRSAVMGAAPPRSARRRGRTTRWPVPPR